jgi:hypothetical protein
MAARKSKLHPATRLELATNLGQIRTGVRSRWPETLALALLADFGRHLDSGRTATGPSSTALPNELGRLGQRRSGHDLDSVGETGFVRALNRDNHPRHAPPRERRHHRQEARYGPQLPSKGQLPKNGPPAIRPYLLRPYENPKCHGQIEGCAALAHFRRRKVHGYPPRGILVAAIADRATDAFSSLLKRGVSQPDDRESGQARGDVDFDPDGASIQALKCG